MRITFIEPTPPDVAAFGTRALAAYLKSRGKDVRVIFLPGGVSLYKSAAGARYTYDPRILDQLVELARGSGLVGLSFMSNYLDRAMQLAAALKQGVDAPLIVGGIHPTVMPERCLEFADIVCRGEGEEAVLELVERLEAGLDYADVKNLWLRRDGEIVKNPQRPPIADLDSLPFFDFSLEGHYIFDVARHAIAPMTKELLERSFPMEPAVEGTFYDSYTRTRNYKTMTTRGCPHHCTYCAESFLKNMYKGHGYLRKRSIDNVMQELAWVRRELPFVQSIFAFDDTFLVRPLEEIQEFCRRYKAEIGLPLHIQASPTTTTREKIEALVDAGLSFVEMGIQTTSPRGMELYRRNVSEDTILKAADVYKDFVGRIHPPCYHVILDNPWETVEDYLRTLDTVLKLPPPFWMKRASLVCFPGTELYTKAWKDGVIVDEADEWRQIYNKHLHHPHGTYVNFLFYLAGFSRLPRPLVRLLAARPMVKLLQRDALRPLFSGLYTLGERLIFLSKGVRALVTLDFARIGRYFRKVK